MEAPSRGDAGPTDDRQLVRLCLGGDAIAQRELVRRFTPLVWFVCSRAVPGAEAEDVAQEVFQTAFSTLPRYRGECRLATWFYTVALRRVADYRRSPARRQVPAGMPSQGDFPDGPAPAAASPEAAAAEAERSVRVRIALERRLEPVRSVLMAYYLGEMSVAAIARMLGMPEGTVKSHLHRGRRLLRDELRDLC